MKKYEAYKNSGIEWIGQIPKEWEVIKIKNLCNVTDGTHFSPRTESIGKPYVTVSNVNNDFVDVGNALLISEEDFDTLVRQGCQPKVGDVLLSKDGTVGRSAIVGNNNGFVCLSSLGILSPKAGLFSGYLKRSLDSIMLQDQMNRAMAGSALKRITISKINEFHMLLPPLSEQQAIASYLDYKVGQIDASISAINTQIDDLKSYRQSIINEAVTKGLNPNVPMKDSGVEWIGLIPEGWEVLKEKYIFENLDYLREPISSESRERNNPIYDYYGASGVIDKIDHYNVEGKVLLIGEDGANLVMRNLPLIYKAVGRFWVNNHAHILKPKVGIDYDYMYYTMEAADYMPFITGAAQPKLSQENLNRVSYPVPPFSEQKSIASYLDVKTLKIDAAITSLEQQRNDLITLKQSIISEAVTGKIDVRDWKPNK